MRSISEFRTIALFSLAFTLAPLHAQMMDNAMEGNSPAKSSANAQETTTSQVDTKKFIAKSKTSPAKALKSGNTAVPNTPLNDRERTQQMLNRFTFGPRPGEVESVTAMGAQKWFEQQLTPDQINDNATERRIAAAYPILALTPEQTLAEFPSRPILDQIRTGKRPYPTDPIEASMYQVLVAKLEAQQLAKDATPPTDAEVAKKKEADKATALRVAGELFALPKKDRMMALARYPVDERIAFADALGGDQKTQLYADFTPHEREIMAAMASNANAIGNSVAELQQAKMLRAVLSERQLQEVMTDFWFNHFNVFRFKDSDEWYLPAYERDAIRPHALGKFRDLLLATAQSPAMMVYLDNYNSIGPDSIANGGGNKNGKRGTRGLNENYAREVMELHTVSVNGGYTQADVTQLAAVLTGWSVDHPELGGPFVFDPKKHQPGPKHWMGQTVQEDGMNEGLNALKTLASSPKTAHFIGFLIAQRFVADEPPASLVDRLAKSYMDSDGDIKIVLRALVQSPEFNSHKYFRSKVKTPMEYVASTFRSTATDPTNPQALVGTLRSMGMPLYEALPPTGYYITADHWMNSAALVDRLNFAVTLTSSRVGNTRFDAPRLLALGLMSKPAAQKAIAANMSAPHAVAVADTTTPNGQMFTGSGTDVVLGVLESTLIGGAASTKTNQLIHAQMDPVTGAAKATNPTDQLNILTALVMGSPEFQLR